jgi:hypothetical protein
MRTIGMGLGVAIVGATLLAQLAIAPAAGADGGSFIELDRTYYQPGAQAIAKAYVAIPKSERSILERGPFWVYVLPKDVRYLQTGKPIPSGAIRVGMFTIKPANGAFALRAAFTVPQLSGGYYSIATCNDPCTVAGFKERLTGTFRVVSTAVEAKLLKQKGELQARVFGLQRELRKAAQDAELAHGQLAAAQRERDLMVSAVDDLQLELAAAQARAVEAESRRPVIPWAVAGAAIVLLLLVCAVVFTRRRRRSTPMGLSSEASDGVFDDDVGAERLGHGPKVLEDRLGDVLVGEPGDATLGQPSVDPQIDRVKASAHSPALEDDLRDHASSVAALDEALLEEGGDVRVGH